MAVGDLISIWEKVMKKNYIPTGIKKKFVKFSVTFDQKKQVVRTVCTTKTTKYLFILIMPIGSVNI